jgi:hypothetical protein
MKRRKSVFWAIGLLSIAAMLAFSPAVQAVDVTNQEIAAAIKGGQKHLFDNFHDNGDGTGYFAEGEGYGGYTLANTGFSVSALLETGAFNDPAYAAIIGKGINYIKSQANVTTGAIGGYPYAYQTGLCIVALGLYGQAAPQDAAYRAIVQKAVDYLITNQSADGGWTYTPNPNYTSSDLSNTQFGAMGVYYGSRYLGLAIKGQPWATKLLAYLDSRQDANGGFRYYPGWTVSPQMTGAGLWCLAMIEEGALGAGTRAQKAVDWYNTNYNFGSESWSGATWSNGWSDDYYGVYALAKALTGTVGTDNQVGDYNWIQDLKNKMWSLASPQPLPPYDPPTATLWYKEYGNIMETSWVLMSLAFADINVESPNKLLPEVGTSDTPLLNKGTVTLETTGGVTISTAKRGNIGQAVKKTEVTLPIGAFDFTLNNVPNCGTAVLTIHAPANAFLPVIEDPVGTFTNNPDSFVKADGSLKAGLNWFKIQGGEWKGLAGVPIEIDLVANVIRVTLKDGGPEDQDGVCNGKVVDPGAPGTGGTATTEDTTNSSKCFIATAAYGSTMAADVVALRVFRDRYLLTNPLGKAFVSVYYTVSPPIAGFIAKHESLRTLTRITLLPVVAGVKHPGAAMLLFGGFFVAGAGAVVYRRRKEN